MRYLNLRSLAIAAGLVLTHSAFAQQPPMPNPSSDTFLNTAYGTGSLSSLNETATPGAVENSAFGAGALLSNVGGTNNTAQGYQALFQNTSGSWNTAVGWAALWGNTTGNGGTALGYQALETRHRVIQYRVRL
jgi:hypothetical protein